MNDTDTQSTPAAVQEAAADNGQNGTGSVYDTRNVQDIIQREFGLQAGKYNKVVLELTYAAAISTKCPTVRLVFQHVPDVFAPKELDWVLAVDVTKWMPNACPDGYRGWRDFLLGNPSIGTFVRDLCETQESAFAFIELGVGGETDEEVTNAAD